MHPALLSPGLRSQSSVKDHDKMMLIALVLCFHDVPCLRGPIAVAYRLFDKLTPVPGLALRSVKLNSKLARQLDESVFLTTQA